MRIKIIALTGCVVSRPFDWWGQAVYVESLAIKCTALLFTEINGSGRAFLSITGTVTNPMSGAIFATELRSVAKNSVDSSVKSIKGLLWTIAFATRLMHSSSTTPGALSEAAPRPPLAIDRLRLHLLYANTFSFLAPLVVSARSAVSPRHVLSATTTSFWTECAPEPFAHWHIGTDFGFGPKDQLTLEVHVEQFTRLSQFQNRWVSRSTRAFPLCLPLHIIDQVDRRLIQKTLSIAITPINKGKSGPN